MNNEKEGGYMVIIPSLPGCITYGKDINDALTMSREAIELYIDEMEERGIILIDDSELMEYTMTLEI
ncbi:type II toxin-antitoxin system HicB family antitoxin [Emticicia sp. CRIBPO]|uniref:type II toxin-antitoxin system HicB family antitoxin n=1 Tax=Emticicia sp. CRIBPO TaxID=2683258 RepID=UPI00286E067F|nr:type II toxin-antitoxin system HicB family antitoxin [Emticicia sp. CRIBPO]